MRRSTLFVVALALSLGGGNATAQRAAELPDAQVREAIIKESIAAYKATRHPCACPFDLMRNGRQCGNVSAYSRPGGASPLCYPKDVSDAKVRDWRSRHP
jgi:hypothetical protein